MSWHHTGDKLQSEPMKAHFIKAYVFLSLNELSH